MSQASQNIAQQFIDGGVVPTQLVGQNAVSKTYVEGQLSIRDANISNVANTAGEALSEVNQLEQRVNKIISDSGGGEIEVRDARGSFPILGARLDASSLQLSDVSERTNDLSQRVTSIQSTISEKMDKNTMDIAISQINKNKGLLDQTYFTAEFLQTLTNNGTVATVPLPKSVTKPMLAFNVPEALPSKNLFDKTTVTPGVYINYGNGDPASLVGSNGSDYIPVLPSTNYIASGVEQYPQSAWYDSNKNFISGSLSVSLLSPSNAAYLRITVPDAYLETAQVEKGISATSYESHSPKIDVDSIKGIIPSNMLERKVIIGEKSKNLFDKIAVTPNTYINYSGGEAWTLNGYNASDFIPILPNTEYRVSGTAEQCAFYNINKDFVSGLVSASLIGVTPPTAAYIRLTVKNDELDRTQLEKGNAITKYEEFGYVITPSMVRDASIKVVTVRPDGAGDYLSPKLANDAINDASKDNQYIIKIFPGTYTDVNWTLKNYVHLIGIDKNTCWLKGELPSNSSDNDITNKSTIDVKETNRIENLKITAKNMRYAIHDESGNTLKDWARNIKNCHIEHYGNEDARNWRTANPSSGMSPSTVWDSECAYGSGFSSGAILIAEDTTFKSPFAPFSVHNLDNFDKPCEIYLKRCSIIKTKSDYPAALRISSLGSGTKDKFVLEGCQLNAAIIHEGTNLDFVVDGFGNSEVPYISNILSGVVDRPNFTDEYNHYIAQSSVSKGQAVRFVGDYITVKAMTDTDDISLFAGFAVEDIPANATGKVKTRGIVAKSDLYNSNGISITFGTKFGVSSTSAIVASTNSIAIGLNPDNIRIKSQ